MTKKPYASEFPPFYAAVDVVVLTIRDDALQAMAIRRSQGPGEGHLALPGGFVQLDEDLETAARRELREETGLSVDLLEQVRTYGAPDRDPRHRTISVLHLAVVPDLPEGAGGTDATEVLWVKVSELQTMELPFDHNRMLDDALERARVILEYSPLAASFCGEVFTIGELRRVYETIWSTRLDPANFSRKVHSIEDYVEPTGETISVGPGRPARQYRLGDVRTLNPPLTR